MIFVIISNTVFLTDLFRLVTIYRAFDEKKARLGIGECVNHELMIPYQVLYEKDGQLFLELPT